MKFISRSEFIGVLIYGDNFRQTDYHLTNINYWLDDSQFSNYTYEIIQTNHLFSNPNFHIKKQPLPTKNQIFTIDFIGISKKYLHLANNLKI